MVHWSTGDARAIYILVVRTCKGGFNVQHKHINDDLDDSRV